MLVPQFSFQLSRNRATKLIRFFRLPYLRLLPSRFPKENEIKGVSRTKTIRHHPMNSEKCFNSKEKLMLPHIPVSSSVFPSFRGKEITKENESRTLTRRKKSLMCFTSLRPVPRSVCINLYNARVGGKH